ncbi:MAG: GcvT family protein [Limimaricola sp.]
MSDLPTTARVVIIGGGAVGTSALYHLALAGWSDCVLLERNELTAGSTWHAAGNVPIFSTDWAVMNMQRYSAGLYRELGERVGYPLNYHVSGSIRLAHSAERMQEFAQVRAMGDRQGLPIELLDVAQTKARYPFLETHDLAGALYDPHDGDIDPAQLTQALAKGARDLGARIIRFCPVTGVRRQNGQWVVEHEKGEIACDKVVNAAGYYAGRVGQWFVPHGGRPVPMAVMAHQYMLTDEIAEIEAWSRDAGRKLPLLRDVDTSYYLRQEKHGYNLGPYERECRAHWLGDGDPLPEDFSFQLFPDDLDRLEPYIEDAMHRVPLLAEAGINKVINGPIPYAPDGLPLIGPMPGVPDAFEACAFTFGIAQAGGAGKVLSEWVIHGRTEWDCWSLDPRRFTDYTDPDYCVDKAREVYGHEFAMHFPHHEWPAGRDRKLSPLHERIKAAGGQMGVHGGWERANWFAKPGDDVSEAATQTWSRNGPWEVRVREEVAAVRSGVGVLDLPGFTRFEIEGAGTARCLNGLIAGRLPKPGRLSLGYVCDDRGHVRTEFSVLRLESDRVTLIGAAPAQWHDADLLRAALPGDGTITVTDRTRALSTLVVCGPESRTALRRITDADLSLPWLSHQAATVAGRAALLVRVCFAGELGWEIHAPLADMETIHDAVRETGARPFGMYALNAMRLEKGYGAWRREFSGDYSALESGLDRFVKLDKATDFPGKAALAAQAAAGPARRLVSLVVDAPDSDAPGAAPVWQGDRIVGEVTSAGYGQRVEAAIALAMVESASAAPGTALEIDIRGDRRPASVQPGICRWDPANERIRA